VKNTGFDTSLRVRSTDYLNDLTVIHNYHSYFDKETYNDVVYDLVNNKLLKLYVNTNYREIITVDNLPKDDAIYNHFHLINIDPIILPTIIDKATENNVPLYFDNFTPNGILFIQSFFNQVLQFGDFVLPFVFISIILSSIINIRNLSSSHLRNTAWTNFLNNNTTSKSTTKNTGFPFMANLGMEKSFKQTIQNISMNDWIGSPEVVEECKDVISYMENKEKYNIIGAEMPKGILLEGPPGTGKTLLAKAIASETNSSFFAASASEFVELYVGTGAARIRDLFQNARENSPSIIFIDEIDAIGKQRGNSAMASNDEREQTLNQLLYEMDGFNNNDNILIMAATNRKDVLDQALLRPGRFDRIIRIPFPDKNSRRKILDFYFGKKMVDGEIEMESIAEITQGFSGAQLKNLVNDAAILSIKNGYTAIQEKYVFDSFEKSIVGLIRTNATINNETRLRVAVHEAGHALLVLHFYNTFEFQKVSIQPTYNGAGGYTLFTERTEIKEGGLYTKDILKKRLVVIMGGKAAETIFYGKEYISVGAFQDLKEANQLARRMIGQYGMGNHDMEMFFNMNSGDDVSPFSMVNRAELYAETTKTKIDEETMKILHETYNVAKKILENNKDVLYKFTDLLLNNTYLYKKDIDTYLGNAS